MMKRFFLVVGAFGLSLTALSLTAAAPAPETAQQPSTPPAQAQPAQTQFVEEQQSFTIVAVPCQAPAGSECAETCPDKTKDHDKAKCHDRMKCPDKAKDHDKVKCHDKMKCCANAPAADYSDNDYALAYELLELTGAPENLDEANDIMIAVQMQQTPALKPAHAAFKEFFARHCSYEAMKRDLARVHLETFTRDELKKLIDFFKTPVGKKLARCRGGILRKSLALREKRIHANLPELHRNVEKALNAASAQQAPAEKQK